MSRPVDDLDVITAMQRYGGGFVKALAAAAGKADPDNLEAIKNAFPHYWRKYTEVAQRDVEALSPDAQADGHRDPA